MKTKRRGRFSLLGLFLWTLPSFAVTVTFRDGEGGYVGIEDTFLEENAPATSHGAAPLLRWDGDHPAGTGRVAHVLLRFNDTVGNGAGQIPPGASITSAILTYTVTNPGNDGAVHEAAAPWTEGTTYAEFCGVTCDGTQIGPLVATALGPSPGVRTVNVTTSVAAWAKGGANLGWIIVPSGADGVELSSRETPAPENRPLLTVVYDEVGVLRGPYLQLGTPTSMTVAWRTDTPTDSRVRYGTAPGSLDQEVVDSALVTDHVVTLTGLTAATRYSYDVGSTADVLSGGTNEHFFETSPVPGAKNGFRAWVLGDSGVGGSAQVLVRDSMLQYTSADPPDLFVHVGDIAYATGTDQEFTFNHFAVYQDVLRHTPFWPTLGNHEGASTVSGQPGPSAGPYYEAFVLPAAGEAGGEPSGTEAYYSFDYANVHFICLNSYQVSREPRGAMAQWLLADLAATLQPWVIAFWHHPPYSHGTHNLDNEGELLEMRENLLPILEAGGVDLILAGHSHGYERSYLIDGAYMTPTPDFATLRATGHVLDDGDGTPGGDGDYRKSPGLNAHEGAVYVVAGHGGAATGGPLDHPVMYFSESAHGSVILDVNGATLTIRNLRSTGVVSDTFTIVKTPPPPRVASTSPVGAAVVSSLPTVQVTFTSEVSGVDAGDLTVNGSAASAVSPVSGGVYVFSGFSPPGNGLAQVVLAAGGIADASDPALVFSGDVWSYTVDTEPPRVARETPRRGRDVSTLRSVTIEFSEPVAGVAAGDLTVNGSPATSFSGSPRSPGPYRFSGYAAPGEGPAQVALSGGAILDEKGQPFAGDSWSHVVRPRLLVNELLATNDTVVADEFGDFDDYVEIYNPSPVPVTLGGMHLTDDPFFPAQYEIPEGVVIPPFGHLLFWCDGEPGEGPLHTNFTLLEAGEEIGLHDTAEGELERIDGVAYSNQMTDVPDGRFPDGARGLVAMPPTPGAANVLACGEDTPCGALTGECATGRCLGGRCVAQPANEGVPCDDGIPCRDPDRCDHGTCGHGADLCAGDRACNLLTGSCELEQLPIRPEAVWRYLEGTAAPPAGWNALGFDDTGWLEGPSGFGYGPDCIPGRGTTLEDMKNGYLSLYLRRGFHVGNPAGVGALTLTADYDDSFVVYLNGAEVARRNLAGTPPPNAQSAGMDHECSDGLPPNPPETMALATAALLPGANVIAIQAHNFGIGSFDFTLVPVLTGVETLSCSTDAQCDDHDPCTAEACSGGACVFAATSTACDDGDPCTAGDACTGGSCAGVPLEVPGEDLNLRIAEDKATLAWDPPALGPGIVHDLVRGLTSDLPVDAGAPICLEPGLLAATASDRSSPPPGLSYWYLVRARNACGAGTYGFEGRGGIPGIERITGACP